MFRVHRKQIATEYFILFVAHGQTIARNSPAYFKVKSKSDCSFLQTQGIRRWRALFVAVLAAAKDSSADRAAKEHAGN